MYWAGVVTSMHLVMAMALAAWAAEPWAFAGPTDAASGPSDRSAFPLFLIPLAAALAATVVWAVRRGGARAKRLLRGYLGAVAAIAGSVVWLQPAWALGLTGDVAFAAAVAASALLVWAAWSARATGVEPLRNVVTMLTAAGTGALTGAFLGVWAVGILFVVLAVVDAVVVRRGAMQAVATALVRLDAPYWVGATRKPAAAASSAGRPSPGPELLLGMTDLVLPAAWTTAVWLAAGTHGLWVIVGALAGLTIATARSRTHGIQAGLPWLAAGSLPLGILIVWLS